MKLTAFKSFKPAGEMDSSDLVEAIRKGHLHEEGLEGIIHRSRGSDDKDRSKNCYLLTHLRNEKQSSDKNEKSL